MFWFTFKGNKIDEQSKKPRRAFLFYLVGGKICFAISCPISIKEGIRPVATSQAKNSKTTIISIFFPILIPEVFMKLESIVLIENRLHQNSTQIYFEKCS